VDKCDSSYSRRPVQRTTVRPVFASVTEDSKLKRERYRSLPGRYPAMMFELPCTVFSLLLLVLGREHSDPWLCITDSNKCQQYIPCSDHPLSMPGGVKGRVSHCNIKGRIASTGCCHSGVLCSVVWNIRFGRVLYDC